MKLKFAGMAMIAIALVLSQIAPSEAGHHHRKSRCGRGHIVAQAPVYNHNVATVSSNSVDSSCGCGSSSVNSNYGSVGNAYGNTGTLGQVVVRTVTFQVTRMGNQMDSTQA